jgi:hypothetical protein
MSIDARLSILRDPAFRQAARAFWHRQGPILRRLGVDSPIFDDLGLMRPAPLRAHLPRHAARLELVNAYLVQLQRFIRRWRAQPPLPGILDAFSRTARGRVAILTGEWAVIPVFPWTTHEEVRRTFTRVQKTLPKTHQDARTMRRAAEAAWLAGHHNVEIAQAVLGTRRGSQRPTRAQVIKRLPFPREQALRKKVTERMTRRLKRTPTAAEVDRELYRMLRGHEAPAAARIRLAGKRFLQQVRATIPKIKDPTNTQAASYAITRLLREPRSKDGKLAHDRWRSELIRQLTRP